MCVNQKRVPVRNGLKYMYVECGHCDACKQKRAGKRASRIRHEMQMKDGFPKYDVIFGTLTYRNSNIPYIRISDVDKFFQDETLGIPVHRDEDIRYYRGSPFTQPGSVLETVYLEDLMTRSGSFDHLEDITFEPLRKWVSKSKWVYYDTDKVSVAYFKDLQNFWKRVRINAERAGNYDKISFFNCSEYGENGCRAHFHFISFVPFGSKQFWKEIFIKSWPYDDGIRNRIKDDLGSASYLSTYVNLPSSLCSFLSGSPCFRPHHSFSQGFGLGFDNFTFDQVVKNIRQGDFIYHEDVRTHRGQSVKVDSVVPQYVVNHWFPKFKGYSKLTSDEIRRLLSNSANIAEFLDDKNVCADLRMILCDIAKIYQYRDYDTNIIDVYNRVSSGSVLADFIEKNFFSDHDFESLQTFKFSPSKFFDGVLMDFFPGYHGFNEPGSKPVCSKTGWTVSDVRNIFIMLCNKKRRMIGRSFRIDGVQSYLSEDMYIDLYVNAWTCYYSSNQVQASTRYDDLNDLLQFQHCYCNNDYRQYNEWSKYVSFYKRLTPESIVNINDNPIEQEQTKFYSDQYRIRSKDRKCKSELASYFYKY